MSPALYGAADETFTRPPREAMNIRSGDGQNSRCLSNPRPSWLVLAAVLLSIRDAYIAIGPLTQVHTRATCPWSLV
ncbi:MAG: hypothetical protein ACN6O0_14485, partial [Achromobacter spanius]